MDKLDQASKRIKRQPSLRVRRGRTEFAIRLLRDQGILGKAFQIKDQGESVGIPLARRPSMGRLNEIKTKIPDAILETGQFNVRKSRPETLEEILSESIPEDLLAKVPKSFDFVGDIAIFDSTSEMRPYHPRIGGAIMKLHPNIMAVFARAGAVSGPERIRPLRHVAGEDRTVTTHREFGCSFKVDLSKVFFSPRLSTEHRRVAGQVSEGETVVDMFAGVGPFSILIAKNSGKVSVHAIDVNPEAVKLLSENARLNKVTSKVEPHLGDARKILPTLSKIKASRIIMNHPSSAAEFVDVACDSLRSSGGTVHYYTFVGGDSSKEKATSEFRKAVEQSDHRIERIEGIRKVREIGPMKWQVVIDAYVIP